MNFYKTKILSNKELTQTKGLWNMEYPQFIMHRSEESLIAYLNGLSNKNHILLKDNNGDVKGWLMDFDRDNEKWFVIILDSEIQGHGYGSKLLDEGKNNNQKLNGWVIETTDLLKANNSVYQSPLAFYKKNGFVLKSEIKLKSDLFTTIKVCWQKI